ncbi:MAG: aldehyde dehydrogenase family protein [Alphaproteobacteria bacterium]|nr:aldehyde dehydrogenase family protein [Alphaproteobacteria bacterium]MCZ6588893.1 aldehyde dehydrogenase family protein [Alphaproteobacteria bacterium]
MTEASQLTVEQPYDGAIIDELPYSEWSEVDAMLARATAAFENRDGWLPAYRRIEVLRRLATLLRDRTEDFAILIAREGGKPLTDARIEAERAVNGVELAAEGIADLHGQEIPMDLTEAGASRLAFTRKEPIGPVVAVSAFNHPLNLIVHQVAPAIATGCPVIVKPADTTPLSCLKFVDLLHQAGLPEAWCQVCVCDIPTAERLVTDPRVAFFSFIGSSRVGWYLRSKLAPGTRCALEHGGAAPVLVCDDADLNQTIPSLVKGGYYHAGQVCVSVQRIFVENRVRDEFCSAFADKVGQLVTGDPTAAETDVGPLILPREVDRVANWVDEAVSGGAQILAGGTRLTERVYDPTILLEPPADANISTLEVFGPVCCIYGFDDVADAVARANGLPLAFQAAVYTKNLDRAFDLSNRLEAGAVMVNEHSAFRVDWMPFAGRRSSGYGVGGIHHTMTDMTQEKMIVINTSANLNAQC